MEQDVYVVPRVVQMAGVDGVVMLAVPSTPQMVMPWLDAMASSALRSVALAHIQRLEEAEAVQPARFLGHIDRHADEHAVFLISQGWLGRLVAHSLTMNGRRKLIPHLAEG